MGGLYLRSRQDHGSIALSAGGRRYKAACLPPLGVTWAIGRARAGLQPVRDCLPKP